MSTEKERAEALEHAKNSLRIEGLFLDDSDGNADLFAALVDGTMTGAQVRTKILERVHAKR